MSIPTTLDDVGDLSARPGSLMTTEQRLDTGDWTVVAVRDTGEVHINHGPAFPCFLTLDWCACCTCSACRDDEEST